ncbi:uncharacterized protein LOC9650711 [Selaginella moellendorffii]|uniref:uncharacterized protein LOC9650711 n=1 Tax=Selaginella moellendorffii TaxID=88036 RepID=UPI000D1CBA73|nr:uncharacterized protein LOC9650711 [Selaginella moellendorffii]|eukprot:XP_024518796.1 uncharacterized protein LOC9650711 [Selaginella moellendorffii]
MDLTWQAQGLGFMRGMNRAAAFLRARCERARESASLFVKARKKNARKAQRIGRKIMHYLRTDFKEIAWPSSLPNPPGRPRRQRFFAKETLREAWKLYKKSWTSDFEIYGVVVKSSKKKEAAGGGAAAGPSRGTTPQDEKFPSIYEELEAAVKLGGEHVKPALQRIYMTRATVYRDAVRSFIDGYKQGIRESAEKSTADDKATEQVVNEAKRAAEEAAKSQRQYAAPSSSPSSSSSSRPPEEGEKGEKKSSAADAG